MAYANDLDYHYEGRSVPLEVDVDTAGFDYAYEGRTVYAPFAAVGTAFIPSVQQGPLVLVGERRYPW